MLPTLPRAHCKVYARKPGKASSPGASQFFRGLLRCYADMLPENANDKIRSRGRAGHGQASPLSTRVDKDRRTQSGPAVPLPKFPPLRANSVERDIGPYVTQEANESSRHASAHLPSRSPSGREQSEHARRAARASRYSGSFREDNVSPPADRRVELCQVTDLHSIFDFRFAIL